MPCTSLSSKQNKLNGACESLAAKPAQAGSLLHLVSSSSGLSSVVLASCCNTPIAYKSSCVLRQCKRKSITRVLVIISSAFLGYALCCLLRQRATGAAAVHRCQDLALLTNSLFSRAEYGMQVGWKGVVWCQWLASFHLTASQRRKFALALRLLKIKLFAMLLVLLWSISTDADGCNVRVKKERKKKKRKSRNQKSMEDIAF